MNVYKHSASHVDVPLDAA